MPAAVFRRAAMEIIHPTYLAGVSGQSDEVFGDEHGKDGDGVVSKERARREVHESNRASEKLPLPVPTPRCSNQTTLRTWA